MDPGLRKQMLEHFLHRQCDDYITNLFAFALSPDSARLPRPDFLHQMQLIIDKGTGSIQKTLNDIVEYVVALNLQRFKQLNPESVWKTDAFREIPTAASLTAKNGGVATQSVTPALPKPASSNSPMATKKRKLSPPRDPLPLAKKKKVGTKVKVPEEWRLDVKFGTWKCPIDTACTEEFQSSGKKLKKHLKQVHQMERFYCLVRHCKASFADETELPSHIESGHRSFPCRNCAKEFSHFDHLAAHFERCHERGTFTCSHCDFTSTTNRNEVLRHQNVLPPKPLTGDEALFGCPVSGCDYKAEGELKVIRHQQGVHIKRSCSDYGAIIPGPGN